MTPPVTTDALREALARSAIEAKFGPEGVAVIFDAPDEATEHQRAVLAARAEEARRVADFAIAGPLAPLLAAHQQVTAERDAERAEHARYRASAEEMWETAKRHGCQMLAEKRRADAAEAAEDDRFAVEYTTARGAMAYEHMARVLSGRLRRMDRRAAAANRRADATEASLATATADLARLQAEGEDLRAALRFVKTWIDTDLPAGTSRAGTVHRAITKALDRTALARAATAREGRADE